MDFDKIASFIFNFLFYGTFLIGIPLSIITQNGIWFIGFFAAYVFSPIILCLIGDEIRDKSNDFDGNGT